jgi:pentatricopeptide repeat protein
MHELTYFQYIWSCSNHSKTLKNSTGDTFSHFQNHCNQMLIKSLYHSYHFVGTSLVDMYAKCRWIEDAQRVFNNMPLHAVIAWNTMILGHVKSGQGQKALKLFQKMQGMLWNSYFCGGAECMCQYSCTGRGQLCSWADCPKFLNKKNKRFLWTITTQIITILIWRLGGFQRLIIFWLSTRKIIMR